MYIRAGGTCVRSVYEKRKHLRVVASLPPARAAANHIQFDGEGISDVHARMDGVRGCACRASVRTSTRTYVGGGKLL